MCSGPWRWFSGIRRPGRPLRFVRTTNYIPAAGTTGAFLFLLDTTASVKPLIQRTPVRRGEDVRGEGRGRLSRWLWRRDICWTTQRRRTSRIRRGACATSIVPTARRRPSANPPWGSVGRVGIRKTPPTVQTQPSLAASALPARSGPRHFFLLFSLAVNQSTPCAVIQISPFD